MRDLIEDFQTLAGFVEAGNRWEDDANVLEPGRLLRRLRQSLQWSQRELSARSGVPRAVIVRLETGGDIRLSSLKALFDCLGCRLVFLPQSEEMLRALRGKAEDDRWRREQWNAECRELDGEPLGADDAPILSKPPARI